MGASASFHVHIYIIYTYVYVYIYSSGHTLRTPFGKRMVETSAAECVLSIHLEHLKNIHLEHVLKGT